MARYAYFADLPDGTIAEWRETVERGQVRAARGIKNDGRGKLEGFIEGRGWVPVTRKVEMKSMPSRHACDSRCLNATGRIMKCECACGGRNHGRGSIACEAA